MLFHRLYLSLESISLRKLHEGIRGGGGGSIGLFPPTFDTIHPIDLIIDTSSEISLYFQLIETTWCLIGFHGSHSHINTSPLAAIFYFKFTDFFNIRTEH